MYNALSGFHYTLKSRNFSYCSSSFFRRHRSLDNIWHENFIKHYKMKTTMNLVKESMRAYKLHYSLVSPESLISWWERSLSRVIMQGLRWIKSMLEEIKMVLRIFHDFRFTLLLSFLIIASVCHSLSFKVTSWCFLYIPSNCKFDLFFVFFVCVFCFIFNF